jgi:integrase
VLRRTFACIQLILARLGLGGLDLLELQEAMGHESLDTTRVYLSDVQDYLGQMIDKTNTVDAAVAIIEWKSGQAGQKGA